MSRPGDHDLLAARAAGEPFPGSDPADLEHQLEVDAEARRELARLEALCDLVAGAGVAPSAGRRERIRRAVAARRPGNPWPWRLAAAALLAVGLGLAALALRDRDARDVAPPVAQDPPRDPLLERLAGLETGPLVARIGLDDLPGEPSIGAPGGPGGPGGDEGAGGAPDPGSSPDPLADAIGVPIRLPGALPAGFDRERTEALGRPDDPSIAWIEYAGPTGRLVLLEGAAGLPAPEIPAGWLLETRRLGPTTVHVLGRGFSPEALAAVADRLE